MPALAFCGECGQKLFDGKPFCGNCGHNNAGGAATTPAKSGGSGGSGGGGAGGKICGGCKRSLEGALRYTTALDKEWHIECFVCSKCKSDLNGGKFFVQEGEPICANCTQSTGPKCAGCNKPCGEKYIGALDKMWHHACFVCGGCSKSLAGGVGFITRGDNKPYCDSACANKAGGGGGNTSGSSAVSRPVAQVASSNFNSKPQTDSRPAAQVSSSNFASKPQTDNSTCSACSRNAGKAFCPECGKKLGGAAPNNNSNNNANQQREREQREREQQQLREKEQREKEQQQQRQREQQQREQQQREQQQREQQQRQQQQAKPQASPAAKSYFCGECGTKMAAPSFCPECGHNNGPAAAPAAAASRPTPAVSKPYQAPAAPSAPSGPPDAPDAPPDAPGAPPMAPSAPPAPSGYSSFAAPGGKALPAGRGDLLAQINAGKKLKKAPKPAERGADGLPVGMSESGGGGGGGGGGAKKPAGGAAGGRGGPMDMQAQLAAKLASRNK